MFDKDLFLSLCERYDVELSASAVSPMITAINQRLICQGKEEEQMHSITIDDVNRVFAHQTEK